MALLTLLICSIAIDAIFVTGYCGMDSRSYLTGAHDVLRHGTLPETITLAEERLAMLGWNVIVGSLTDWNAQLVATSYLVFHVGLVLCTFVFAARWFGWLAGLVAGWTLAIFPELAIHSTIVVPDTLLALLILLAVGAFLAAYSLRDAGRFKLSLAAFATAGVLIGLAYTTKSAALVLLPFLAVSWLIAERFRPGKGAFARGAVLVAGVAVVFLAEWAAFHLLTGKPYFRLAWLFADAKRGETLYAAYGTHPWERLLWFVKRVDGTRAPYDLCLMFLAGLLLFPAIVRRRWTVALLPIWWFAYLTWGSASFSSYYPGPIHFRYYIPALPFGAIAFGACVAKIGEFAGRRINHPRWQRGLLAVVLIAAGVCSLRHLHAVDRLAGKFYRASVIVSASQALEMCAETGLEPIVVSDPLYNEMSAIYLDTGPVGFKRGKDVTKPELETLLKSGFYYIGSPQAIYNESNEVYRRSLIDDLLHPATREKPYPIDKLDPDFANMVEDNADGSRRIVLHDGTIEVRELARFGRRESRLHEIAGAILNPDLSGPIDPAYRQAAIFRILPISEQIQSTADNEAPTAREASP